MSYMKYIIFGLLIGAWFTGNYSYSDYMCLICGSLVIGFWPE